VATTAAHASETFLETGSTRRISENDRSLSITRTPSLDRVPSHEGRLYASGTSQTPAPEVSVVIPTRNRWELLSRHALASALGQTGVELEVVVVDDGSDDGSEERLEAVSDSRVRAIFREQRGGQALALNAGIEAARGEWIAFLDDDDLWSPRKLRAQLDAASSAASFVYGSMVAVDMSGRVLENVSTPPPAELRSLLRRHNVLRCPSSVMARSASVRKIGGLDETLNELTDWDFFIRLADAGRSAACEEIVVAYLVHPANRRLRQDSDVETEFRYLAAKHQRSDLPLERAGFSRWVAMGHLRAGRKRDALGIYVRSAVRDRNAGNAVRAGAALFGERAFKARRRIAGDSPDLPWLRLYLDDGATADDGSDGSGVLGVEAPLEEDERAEEEHGARDHGEPEGAAERDHRDG
jgi:glycosyltransferase involved in cell wall biosynthesis